MIENDAFKLLLINLFHLNPDDIANILCTTFNKMMVLVVTLTDKHQACPYCGFTAPKIKEYVTKENLFHLNPDDIANILCTTFNKMMVLVVTLADKHQACPYCGFTAPKIKEYVTKEITHSALTTQKCIIKYPARRYKCSCCGKTYYEFNPFVFKSQKISILTVHNILKDLKDFNETFTSVHNILKDLKDFNETFTSVARRYHVSRTSVSTIFDNHVDIDRNPLPEIINIYEVYAFTSERNKF